MKNKIVNRLLNQSKKLITMLICVLLCVSICIPTAFASENSLITYTSGEYTFEKVSHPNRGLESADGIVDYIGNGSVAPYIDGKSEGNGDRGQSYSYASATYGDWVYINTMYGGLGVSSILGIGMAGMEPEISKAFMDVMYNGNLYTGEPDGKYAGGILVKFNVKTGETKLIMSRDTNGLIPTFRSAIKMNNKLYFVGMVIDVRRLTQQEIATAIAMQSGFPCIYEIDPENNDKLTCIYDCVDLDGYHKLVEDKVFPSTRAICTYKNSLVAGCLDTEGVFLCASNNPSEGKDSFKVIATMEDLFNYPAYHRQDVNGGGGIYQVIEFNGKLYVVICTGTAASKNPETGTLQTYAIVRGECSGDATDKNAWKWSVLAGDKKDGAKYPFGLDEERLSCGACSLEVYKDYLYIGEYNDVSSALQGFVLRKDFTTQATNLQQSINLYRMNADEDVEMIVGDPTTHFPEGGITGMGSGYETHMSQYTWQTMVYEGKLYVSTMDTTTLLEPIAQFTNGDLVGMSKTDWEKQINYIRVLIELLNKDNKSVVENISDINIKNVIDNVVALADKRTSKISVKLTDEQKDDLENYISDNFQRDCISEKVINKLNDLNYMLEELAKKLDDKVSFDFYIDYEKAVKMLEKLDNIIPESAKPIYEMLLSYATAKNLEAIVSSLKYMSDSKAGFDLYEITQYDDGSVDINTVTNDGFGDRFNHGLRIFAQTPDYLLIGTANPFYGTQLWRRENTKNEPAKDFEIGDVNRNGKVDIMDATEIKKYIAEMLELDDEQLWLGDVDGDGSISIKDASEIQKMIVGLI